MAKKQEKIRRKIEGDCFVDGDSKLKVTVSIGATIIAENDTETSVFQSADKALFRRKKKVGIRSF